MIFAVTYSFTLCSYMYTMSIEMRRDLIALLVVIVGLIPHGFQQETWKVNEKTQGVDPRSVQSGLFPRAITQAIVSAVLECFPP